MTTRLPPFARALMPAAVSRERRYETLAGNDVNDTN